jgi:hypothetical protein
MHRVILNYCNAILRGNIPMSTYYQFKCKKCNRIGGFYSRQAWGWGNFNIIDSFKFIAYHTENCGEEYIGVISEHDENFEADLIQERIDFYTRDTIDHFPLSNDWKFMRENFELDTEERNSLWVKQETNGLKADNGIKLHGHLKKIEYENKKNMYIYKALFETFEGIVYTLFGIDHILPEKDLNYFVMGEIVPNEILDKTRDSTGEIIGQLINVRDIKKILN